MHHPLPRENAGSSHPPTTNINVGETFEQGNRNKKNNIDLSGRRGAAGTRVHPFFVYLDSVLRMTVAKIFPSTVGFARCAAS